MKPRKKKPQPKLTVHQLNWLEWVAIGLSIWFVLWPGELYTLLFTLLLFIPVLGLVLNGFTRPSLASLVTISPGKEEKDFQDFDVADFIDIPALAIFIRVAIDYEYESFYSILKVGTISLAILLLILFISHKRLEWKAPHSGMIYFKLIANIVLYSYAATYGINCVYDTREQLFYETTALDKRISKSRRTTSYYIEVAPWGHHYDKDEISVSPAEYNSINPGDTVIVEYNEGVLGIPWVGNLYKITAPGG